jgi:nicotinamide riboside transporter PnuC
MIPALTNNTAVAYPVGLIIAAAFLVIFLTKAKNADKAPSKVA